MVTRQVSEICFQNSLGYYSFAVTALQSMWFSKIVVLCVFRCLKGLSVLVKVFVRVYQTWFQVY